jgi:hypothetical protein
MGERVASDIDARPPRENEAVRDLQQTMQKIVDQYRGSDLPPERESLIRQALAHVGWRPVVEHLKWAIGQAPINPLAQAALVDIFAHFVVAPIAAVTGHVAFASLAAFFPVWIPYLAIHKGVGLALMKIYGGKQAYDQALKAEGEMLDRMKMTDLEHLVGPLADRDGAIRDGLSVAPTLDLKGRLIQGVAETLGFRKRGLTFDALAQFLQGRGFEPRAIAALRAETGLPDEYKAVLLLGRVAAKRDPVLNADLRKAFQSYVVKLAGLPADRWGLRAWASRFADVRSSADVRALMREVPQGVPVKVMARLWDESLIGVIAENLPTLNPDRLPRLRRQFEMLRAQALAAPKAVWSPEWEKRFAAYLDRLVPPNQCDGFASIASPAPQG